MYSAMYGMLCTVDARTTAVECKVGTSITSRFVETKARLGATNTVSPRFGASRRVARFSRRRSAVLHTARVPRTTEPSTAAAPVHRTTSSQRCAWALQTAAPHRKVERTEESRNREGRQVQVKSERYTIITRNATQSYKNTEVTAMKINRSIS